MKLSVVIVNYNVKYFLEQCLDSVVESAKNVETEIFVVDNNSVDGSCAMIKTKFPQIKLIENKKNYGFSYANNQAIKQASGEYILLLNPDTVIEEKTLKCVCDFMEQHSDAGGLGVKMIDGKGRFLPESKRGLPTPSVAFYKIFGLSKIFPRSKKFGQYHLTYLDKDQTHVVDVLSGAFMLLRKKTLDKIGLLDEEFFMYGEDIDLSYRITLAGYKNYYYPETTIIHYKGESTKKGSVNYVIVFYNAMIIFAKKHFSQKSAGSFSVLINIAIYFRAGIAILHRFIKTIIIPLIDTLIILLGFLIISPLWSGYKLGEENTYPQDIFAFAITTYIILWILSLIFTGGYDKPVKLKNVYQGIITGSILILVIYSLLPLELRFSRAIILLGSAWVLLFIPIVRLFLNFTKIDTFKINLPGKKRVAIVGQKAESQNLVKLLNNNNPKIKIVSYVNPNEQKQDSFFEGNLSQIDEIVEINKIDEIIFCIKNMQSQQIIATMLKLNNADLDYKIASSDGFSIIGSNSINNTGELYNIDINSIAKPENSRKKRIIDIFAAFILIILSPILIFAIPHRWQFLKNIFSVFLGTKTFVSYTQSRDVDIELLPKLKRGILSPTSGLKKIEISPSLEKRLNIMYAKDYTILQDLTIIIRSWKELGKF
ncbi:glycosyltransferase family 2 protein [Bacteroidales bacterium OttesenSCG-928-I21]|nr:glycosyltransferase family 2 protein [Bacteroidales bacterium OttesenSCG-928-I21]